MSVSVEVLFFGKAKELSGEETVNICVPVGVTRQNLLKDLVQRFSLQTIESIIVLAVNEEYVFESDELALQNGDRVAIIPPLSGGTTREDGDDVKVEKLIYEAYEDMAVKKMKSICQKMRLKWPALESIAMFHRLGSVAVSEISIVIAASSPHRKDALEAVHSAIDDFKAIVPIWKKEQFTNNVKSIWQENKECQWSSNSVLK